MAVSGCERVNCGYIRCDKWLHQQQVNGHDFDDFWQF